MKNTNVWAGLLLIMLTIFFTPGCNTPKEKKGADAIALRVGIMGAPSFPQVEWNDSNLLKLKALGFNAMQLDIAWGYRPNDEALNLEDVVKLPEEFAFAVDRDSAKTLRTDERIEKRAAALQQRIALCKKHSMRTIFHFGAPFVGYPPQDPFDNCISSQHTIDRYIYLLNAFYKKFPGVDDLLVYTYDQNAWLCSEWGTCKNCHGKPVDKRVAHFINTLAQTWKKLNPDGKLWWEPWEISAGEVYSAIDLLDSTSVGLSIHSNIAEVQVALPADRWFKNVLTKAEARKINVIGEVWLGSPTEELEPYLDIAAPLATLRALRAIAAAGKLTGIKEYYGNIPGKEDPNLRASSLFFSNPGITDEEALSKLSAPYGPVAGKAGAYWKLISEAIELYPWDVSWLAREVGKSDPDHLLSAAALKGASWQTPSWQSTRRTSFMRTDETNEPNFWMREDIQLRCDQAVKKMQAALDLGNAIKNDVPDAYKEYFSNGLKELNGFRRTTLSYVYHLRETNLANIMRASVKMGIPIAEEHINEMKELLAKDSANRNDPTLVMAALNLLEKNTNAFLAKYFIYTAPTGQKSQWSITSN